MAGARLGLLLAAAALAVGLIGAGSGSRAGPTTAAKRSAEAQRGPRGPRGPRGLKGRRGPRGFTGLTGPTGAQGVQGTRGPTGDQGARGPAGRAGMGLERPGLTRTTLEPAPSGRYSSIAVGADALPLISYDGWYRLRVAHCDDLACRSATTATVEPSDAPESYPSVAIGSDGLGLIAYTHGVVGDLKVAHCSNLACSASTTSALGAGQHFAFGELSITIGSDGRGLIAFIDPKGLFPKVAHCEDVECTEATITNLDPNSNAGLGTSVTIGGDGLGVVTYRRFAQLAVAHCSNLACTAATTAVIDGAGSVGEWSSITTGSDGLGLISYLDRDNGALKVAHCSNADCSSAATTTIDTGDTGGFTSITLGADGLGLVTYEPPQTRFGPVKAAHCSDVACSSATVATLDSGETLFGTSVTTGVDGLPLVGYYKHSIGLEVAHCSNVFCIPNFRRR